MKPVIFNQQQRFVRVLMLLAGAMAAIGVISGIIAALRLGNASGVAAIIAVIFGVFCISILISTAATVPAARRASRMIKRMQSGEALAHWVYPTDFWQAWVERERRRFGFAMWGAIAFVMFVGGVIVYALVSTSPDVNPTHNRDAAIAGGVALIVIGFILAGKAVYRRRRTNRLLACGECYLMSDAVYIGGDFAFWNAQLRSLSGAAIRPAQNQRPAVIELAIGMSRGAASATRAVGTASLIAGGPYIVNYEAATRIPVPPDLLSEAERVVTQWNKVIT